VTNEIPDSPLDTVNQSKIQIDCEICNYIIKHIEQMIGSNKIKSEIENALKLICHIIPTSMTEQCELFVKTHHDNIVLYIMNNSNSKKICSLFEFCSFDATQLRGISEPDNYEIKMMPRMNAPTVVMI
jgi:hypothetical protein